MSTHDITVIIFIIIGLIVLTTAVIVIITCIRDHQYRTLTREIQQYLNLEGWLYKNVDDYVTMKSAKSVENYQAIQYFKSDRDAVQQVNEYLQYKKDYADMLIAFLEDNEFIGRPMYARVERDMRESISHCYTYDILVKYVSPAGRSSRMKTVRIDKRFIQNIIADPSILMTKTEFNQYVKAQNKELLEEKQYTLYDHVNKIIDYANHYKDKLIIKGDKEELDKQIASLFDRTINSIKKIKDINSEEWDILDNFIKSIGNDVQDIVYRSHQIYEYYKSPEFAQIKEVCDSLMESQKEFNEYINEKAQSISKLFGTRVVRNETVVEDEYNYIRPYQKSITPFTAEVSAQVFASAENSPLEYIVKYFYPNKDLYPEQIQKLQLLVEELETLKEAKVIIDNYKQDYQQYITDVPSYVLDNDEDGFYSKLGFANISESVLTIEYKFSYTSNGGLAQRNFTVPMTEETIVELINILQSKLTMSAFTKEQRALMTSKLRKFIKERDNYTCQYCGNSTYKEQNLLLEVDHIVPVAKGGQTKEENLQTLCWKCNRNKGDKLI